MSDTAVRFREPAKNGITFGESYQCSACKCEYKFRVEYYRFDSTPNTHHPHCEVVLDQYIDLGTCQSPDSPEWSALTSAIPLGSPNTSSLLRTQEPDTIYSRFYDEAVRQEWWSLSEVKHTKHMPSGTDHTEYNKQSSMTARNASKELESQSEKHLNAAATYRSSGEASKASEAWEVV